MKKNKLVQELSLYTEPKKLMVQKTQGKTLTVKKNKIDEDLQLKSIESMLVESAMSKKQINHLQVSIKKDSKIKD